MAPTARWMEFMKVAMLASCALIVAVTISHALLPSSVDNHSVNITITKPIDGGEVQNKYRVEGTVSKYPLPENMSLWLLVHSHPTNVRWVQQDLNPSEYDKTWYADATFGSPNAKYDIEVASPDENTDNRWKGFKQGDDTTVISADKFSILKGITVTSTDSPTDWLARNLQGVVEFIFILAAICGILTYIQRKKGKEDKDEDLNKEA